MSAAAAAAAAASVSAAGVAGVTAAAARAPAFFVSHGTALLSLDAGSGALRALRDEGARALRTAPSLRGLVVLSAHWASASPPGGALGVGAARGALATIHDHPARHLFSFDYGARGDAALSARVAQLLAQGGGGGAGWAPRLDPSRGLDHGAWLALETLFPGAPLPVVPVELPAPGGGGDALLRLGAALAPLLDEGVAVICSGAATHNQEFFREQLLGGPRAVGLGGGAADVAARRAAVADAERAVERDAPWSVAFDSWLSAALTRDGGAGPDARELLAWARAPGAARAHPEPSHLEPALVFAGLARAAAAADAAARGADATGAGEGAVVKVAHGYQFGLSLSAFRAGS